MSPPEPRLRIRPPARPWRLVVGAGMVVGGAVSCWALIADASQRHDVLILRSPVAAGEPIAAEDLGVVAVGSDDGVPSIAAERIDDVVGKYARYQLVAGALVVDDNLQDVPLVTPGRALVSVVAETGDVPASTAVGDDVVLVLTADATCGASVVSVVDATVTALPRDSGRSSAGSERVAVSVEVDDGAVAVVAMAAKVVVARPNSAEALAAVARPVPDAAGCTGSGSPTGPGGSTVGGEAVDDPTVQAPVPTGVTPLDPSDVLIGSDS